MSKKNKPFKLNRLTMAVMLATATIPQFASAGAGWGDSTNPANPNGKIQTFYASSPSGLFQAGACFDAAGNAAVPAAGGLCDSGGYIDPTTGISMGLRKFVDGLPGLTPAGANNLGQYLPVAVADTATYPGSDYYEIAVVEYAQRMHSDLAKATTLRGYVQIDPVATDSAGASKSVGSNGIALFQIDGVTPVMIARPNGAGGFVQKQAYVFDTPHYLGPVIVANQGTAVRLKFYNALPVGRAANGARNGDLFLPVDETLPGAGFGPDGKVKFTQNRAELHLHGGDNPWISDGTPHQWIAPAGELDAANPTSVTAEAAAKGVDPTPYQRGAAAYNVPDMPNPGPGAVTYYWPNGGSGRLMFYHDHAFGLTRLNVYGGEAAGYVLRDAKEAALTAAGQPLANVPEIPLVIQDRTFVPANIAQQDGKWDTTYWGQPGDVWYPHVYETNQDPNSADATNPVGRWDWGPWFWPVFPSALDLPTGEHIVYAPGTRQSWTNANTGSALPGPSDIGLSEVTTTPEAFNDTPIINGVAYPTVTVEPKAYRFRILNAANDRMMNLGLYVAADAATVNPAATDPISAYAATALCDGTQSSSANCSEVKMVPFIGPNSPTTTTYACPSTGVTAPTAVYPFSFPCAGGLMGTGWGSQDNRPGGVPDPSTAGPNIHLIGNEAGFLAAPVDIPSTPVNYEYNKRSVTVLNVLEHGLFLGSAVRADVVVDFSAYAGKTLILYNDAPAPVPAGDPRLDYYTAGGDQTGAGGSQSTMPGYGPNTRTVMQIKVAAARTDGQATAAYDFAALDSAVTATFAAEQPKPIVAQTAYQPTFGTAAPFNTDAFANIFTGSIYLSQYRAMNFTTTESLTFTPAPGSTTTSLTNTAGTTWNGGTALSQCATAAACQPIVDAAKALGPATAPAGTAVKVYVESKAIQELFDPTWGRMNATLGVELPFTSSLTQTTIPLGYVDPATETVGDGETQFWKITHNGVDSHPVHFHLVNVQVINRVGWDGTVKAPYPEEVGWKETVIMNPLEDIVVAVRAKKPVMPFGLPHSYRALDPSQPLNVTSGFTQVDPKTGNPLTVTNIMEDFMQEYVWHCHILGHEENDFMRAVKFDAKDVKVPAFTVTSAAPVVGGGVTVTWADPTPLTTPMTAYPANPAGVLNNPASEIGFRVERANGNVAVNAAGFAPLGTLSKVNAITGATNALANQTSFTDATATAPAAVTAPSALQATLNAAGSATVLNWTAGTGQDGYNILRNGAQIASVAAGVTTYTDNGPLSGNTTYTYQVVGYTSTKVYSYRVIGVNATGETTSTNDAQASFAGATAGSNTAAVTTPSSSLAAATASAAMPVNLRTYGSSANRSVLLSFTDNSVGETTYKVEACYGTTTQCTTTTATSTSGTTQNRWYTVPAAGVVYTAPAGATGAASIVTTFPLQGGNGSNSLYRFRITPVAGTTVGGPATVSAISPTMNIGGNNAATPAAPTEFTATAGVAGSKTINLAWTDVANNNAGYTVQSRYRLIPGLNLFSAWTTVTNAVNGDASNYAATGLTTNRQYQFRISANGAAGAPSSATVQMPAGNTTITTP